MVSSWWRLKTKRNRFQSTWLMTKWCWWSSTATIHANSVFMTNIFPLMVKTFALSVGLIATVPLTRLSWCKTLESVWLLANPDTPRMGGQTKSASLAIRAARPAKMNRAKVAFYVPTISRSTMIITSSARPSVRLLSSYTMAISAVSAKPLASPVKIRPLIALLAIRTTPKAFPCCTKISVNSSAPTAWRWSTVSARSARRRVQLVSGLWTTAWPVTGANRLASTMKASVCWTARRAPLSAEKVRTIVVRNVLNKAAICVISATQINAPSASLVYWCSMARVFPPAPKDT